MDKVAIFGAGDIGKQVLLNLGNELVEFFFANTIEENYVEGILVISYEEFLKQRSSVHVIVASTKYGEEMCLQLEDSGIKNYFVWDEMVSGLFSENRMWTFPRYNPVYTNEDWSSRPYSLVRSFLKRDFSAYKKIVIYAYTETSSLLLKLMKFIKKSDDVLAVVHPDEAEEKTLGCLIDQMDCLLCAVRRDDNDICDIYEHIPTITTIDLFDIAVFITEFHSKKARKYRDKYKGRRCFVIGNGPSLSSDDLDKLDRNGEITFACNKIYNIFSKTEWRPDFYFLTDVWVLKSATKDILNIVPKECSFYNYAFCNGHILWVDEENIIPIYNMPEQDSVDRMPRFSKDISVHHCIGSSVTYTMLQAAYYMGFKEVYLIGYDHFTESLKKTKMCDHFYDSSKDNLWDMIPKYTKIDNHIKLNNAYRAARIAFEEDGRNVYNATRGGHLEIFNRVDFDSLFEGGK